MEQVKYLEPLSNKRIAFSIDEAIEHKGMLRCTAGDPQFNHVMRDNL